MSGKVAYGYATFRTNDRKDVFHSNVVAIDRVLESVFREMVFEGDRQSMPQRCIPYATPHFDRPSLLRYSKPNLVKMGTPGRNIHTSVDGGYNVWQAPSGTGVDQWSVVSRWLRCSDSSGTIATDGRSYAVGAVTAAWVGDNGLTTHVGTPGVGYFPTSKYHYPAISLVDIAGTRIGNLFKHPTGRTALFNEVGQVALSQGSIEISGVFDPPENRLSHYSYRIYYGSDGVQTGGGSGKTTTGVLGSNGSVTTGSSTFTDGDSQGLFSSGDVGKLIIIRDPATNAGKFEITSFINSNNVTVDATGKEFSTEINMVWEMTLGGTNGSVSTGTDTFVDADTNNYFSLGDVGNFIRIRSAGVTNPINVGTFEITSFNSSSSVEVDATAINQPFVTESGLEWELVQGPIGEYWWQRRPYTHGTSWSSTISRGLSTGWGVENLTEAFGEGLSNFDPMTSIVYDRGCCWWWITNRNSTSADQMLMRWKHMGFEGFDPVYRDGDIVGMPTGISAWRDIDIDSDDNLWIGWATSANDGSNLAKVDPHPGGNSLNPVLLATYTEQTSDSDPNGITSRNVRGICVDDSQAYSAGDRIWVLSALGDGSPGDPDDGGISYTDDGGTTWKRLHRLHARTGTASVSNGDTAVTGSGTSFDTEFAVGDWIRFNGAGRSYEITAIGGPTSMTITPSHVGGETSATIERGALSDGQARLLLINSYSNSPTTLKPQTPAVDYDTNGNLFWIPDGRDRVCKWDESTGLVTEVTTTQMSSTVAMDNQLLSVAVHRIPDPHGFGHTLHNRIWVGHFNAGIALLGTAFDGTHVRYHWTLSDNFAGGTMDMPTATSTHYSPAFILSRVTGQMFIFGIYASGFHDERFQYSVYMNPARMGELADNGIFGVFTIADHQQRAVFLNWQFDDVGMGAGFWPNILNQEDAGQAYNMVVSPDWINYRWTGTQWVTGPVNSINATIDYLGVLNTPTGPYLDMTMAVGSGHKRMHPDLHTLDDGLTIRFVDAGGSVSQVDEFLVDETTTVTCYLGAGKDNIQEASYSIDVYNTPTLLRLDEPVKDCANMWTQDEGIDGGYVNSGSAAAFPIFSRGFAENSEWESYAITGTPYQATNTWTSNSPNRPQVMAALRIRDEGEFSSDGSITTSTDVFGTAGAHTFTATDVGKSVIIEGISGATPDADNGQAVILALLSATQVQVDKTFTQTASNLRWKLRDIPPIRRVGFTTPNGYALDWVHDQEFFLYSSRDYGQTWDQVKFIDDMNGVGSQEGVRQDPGCFFSDASLGTNTLRSQLLAAPTGSYCVWFDLSDLSEDLRRRQYWKVWRVQRAGSSPSYGGNIWLLDDDLKQYGRPSTTRIEDSTDPLFEAMVVHDVKLVPYEATNNGFPLDDGDGDEFTSLLVATGENFYEATGSLNATLTASGHFISPSAIFEPESVGYFLRIVDSANPVDNNGFASIATVLSATEVITDQQFTAEASSFDWQLLKFGENDLIRFSDETTFVRQAGTVLRDYPITIVDVPSSTTIRTVSDELPLLATGLPFTIDRIVPDGTSTGTMSAGGTDLETLQRIPYSGVFGNNYFSEPLEFVELSGDLISATATSAADSDGDGRVQSVVLTTTALDGTFAALSATVGDYLQLENGTMGRRVFEIESLTRDSPSPGQTSINVTYDEIHPSASYNWRILRRRGLRFAWRKMVQVLRETP